MSALHGLILLHEKQFQIAALRNTDSERGGSVSTSVTATGWIHVSIEPTELEASGEKDSKSSHQLKNSNSHPALTSLINSQSPPTAFNVSSTASSGDSFLNSLPKKNSVPDFAPSSSSSISGKTFYSNVWKGMIFLASDPNPSVAQMAQHVVHSVHDKVGWSVDVCVTGGLVYYSFARSHMLVI